jgi:hypothetical protein
VKNYIVRNCAFFALYFFEFQSRLIIQILRSFWKLIEHWEDDFKDQFSKQQSWSSSTSLETSIIWSTWNYTFSIPVHWSAIWWREKILWYSKCEGKKWPNFLICRSFFVMIAGLHYFEVKLVNYFFLSCGIDGFFLFWLLGSLGCRKYLVVKNERIWREIWRNIGKFRRRFGGSTKRYFRHRQIYKIVFLTQIFVPLYIF